MSGKLRLLPVIVICGLSLCASAQQLCPPRPSTGTAVVNPLELHSTNGTLTLSLDLRSQIGDTGVTHYCYVYLDHGTPVEAPTLRLNPGDHLVINFTNNISVVGRGPKSQARQNGPDGDG